MSTRRKSPSGRHRPAARKPEVPAAGQPVKVTALDAYLGEMNAPGVTNLDRLATISMMRSFLDGHERQVVGWARADGVSWSQIGAQLGISKQAAQARFGSAR